MEALIGSTAARFPERDIEIGFFHGSFPSDQLLDAGQGYPLRLSCHPSDLNESQASHFKEAGGTTVELELMTLDPHVLRTCGRAYSVTRVRRMAGRLRAMGFKVGVHLVPGLPGHDIEGALTDAEGLVDCGVPWVDFVRIWPALGFVGATLVDWAQEGRWLPLDVGEAVDVVGQMVAICDENHVEIARIGIQPGQDIPVKAVAGPVHPNLRGEVESRRFVERLKDALAEVDGGSDVVVAVNPKDLHLAKGTSNINSRAMKSQYRLSSMRFQTDTGVSRGTVRLVGEK